MLSLGLRPFGVSLLYVGHDPIHGFQLYHSDPSGNYSGWKATCIGANHSSATSLLKQDYKDDLTLEDAKELVLKVMSKSMDSTKLSSEKCKFKVYRCRRELTSSGICDHVAAPSNKAALGKDLQAIRG